MHLHYKYIILRIYFYIMHNVINLILIQKIRILTSTKNFFFKIFETFMYKKQVLKVKSKNKRNGTRFFEFLKIKYH
jgi:hypothetical protein